MTVSTSPDGITSAPASTVTVALAGRALPLVPALHARLTAAAADPIGWRLVRADTIGSSTHVDIALCDDPASAAVAAQRWPGATIVAVVPARDDGTWTVHAFDAGATVCVRGDDVDLIAAYLRSVTRRRGFTTEGGSR
jgi:hypothetical protein